VTAEPIARVVDDLRRGRAVHLLGDPAFPRHISDKAVNAEAARRCLIDQPVVDATALYRDLWDRLNVRRQAVDVYGDHPSIAPPWNDAMIGYINEHNNAVVLQVHAEPWSARKRWDTTNTVDWPRVRWLLETFIWVGGHSANTGRELPTSGPCHLFQYAIYDDGEPADLHYVHLLENQELGTWEVPQLMLLSALSFLNCRNVALAEPVRPRPERRRLARLGVSVQTIVVRPIGRRTRTSGGEGSDAAVPLSHVRGSFHHYGPRYGKGLLFGKIEGRYWVPAHARGSGDADEARRDYVLKPAAAKAAQR
jgi:hypothetical protein